MNRAQTEAYLIKIDKGFSDDSQVNKEKAWEKILAEDAIMATSGHSEYSVGKESIIKGLKGLYQIPNLIFYWEPKHAEVSVDLSLGYTTGIYTRKYQVDNNKYTETGKYTSIWKKIDGEWKIIHDIGNQEVEVTKEVE